LTTEIPDPYAASLVAPPRKSQGARDPGLRAEDELAENRKFARVHSRLRCWCEGENVTVYARIGNLSEGGLFVRTSTPLERGSRALLRFRDGDQPEVSAAARVVWTSGGGDGAPAGMGLQFEPMDEQALEQIRRIIRGEQQLNASSSSVS
jgi:uncharacterized protein (TIGR02266 family)